MAFIWHETTDKQKPTKLNADRRIQKFQRWSNIVYLRKKQLKIKANG